MRRKPTISISHLQPHIQGYYAISALAKIWQARGCRVNVGLAYAADADVCILHHDLTKLDPASLPAPPLRGRVLNGQVLDISKRSYSTLLLRAGDPWPGPVIVKTNLNHFGVPERQRLRTDVFTKLRRQLARVSWRGARTLPDRFYPLLDSLADVPNWVWSDPALIVEKFVPERTDDGLYCIRGWMFFGNKGYGYRLFSTSPLVKTGTMVRHEFLGEAPDELVRCRDQMKFDFGKFDYVEHAGKPILFDANKTPTFAGANDTPRLRLLAEGIEAFLS